MVKSGGWVGGWVGGGGARDLHERYTWNNVKEVWVRLTGLQVFRITREIILISDSH